MKYKSCLIFRYNLYGLFHHYDQIIQKLKKIYYLHLFENFEFGLYYFSRGINIINNQMLQSKITDLDGKVNKFFALIVSILILNPLFYSVTFDY